MPVINPFNPILMKKIVKALFFSAFFSVISFVSLAQLKLSPTTSFAADIKKVILDYPHQFSNLQGSVLEENPQSTDYACTLDIKGTEKVTITRYPSKSKNIYSWQALVLTTDDFEEAKKKFKSIFTQFNNLHVKMEYGAAFYLKGKYDAPEEEKKFTTVVMSFEKPDDTVKKMKLEITMEYVLLEWKVSVVVYDQERADNERGNIIED